MKILALEFSSGRRSVALVESTGNRRPLTVASRFETGERHTHVFGLLTSALDQAGWQREEIDTIAVGLGPGSYHGIRISIAVAEGWAIGRRVALVGVSSVDSLAFVLAQKGLEGVFTVIVDAQRGEFYRADYIVELGMPRLVEPLRLASLSEIKECLKAGKPVFGPDLVAKFPTIREAYPDAAAVGYLAASRAIDEQTYPLEPIYLRQTAFVKARPPRFG